MLNRFIVFIIGFVLFSACTTYKSMNIDVLIPAKHSIQPEIKSVVIVDNSVPYRGKDVHKVRTLTEKFSVDSIWYDEFSKTTLSVLNEELTYRQFFDTVYWHQEPLKTERNIKNRALSWPQVDTICKKYNADAVVSLEQYAYHTDIDVSHYDIGLLYGYLNASSIILWRVYDNYKEEVVLQDAQIDTISWDAIDESIRGIGQKLPGIKESIKDLSAYMGAEATNLMAPRWETQKRGFYTSGKYQFTQAGEFVRQEKWGEAIKMWKYIYDNSKKMTKVRACYNLALAAEIYGDYKSSLYWLGEGIKEFEEVNEDWYAMDKARLLSYMKMIGERVKQMKALKEQVGIIE